MKHIFPKPAAQILAFFMVLTCFSALNAATYEVFMVRGDILYEGSGEQLAPGTIFASGERIKFQDKAAFAVLIGDGGMYTLSGANLGSKFKANEFVTVKSATVAAKSGLKAKQQPEFKSKADIAKFFSGDPLLILREVQLKIPPANLNLPEDAEFVLRINKAGEPVPVTKKLSYRQGFLTFNGDDIASAGSAEMLSDYKLMIFLAVGQPMEEVAMLNLVVADVDGPFRDEISNLVMKLRTALGEDGMEPEMMKQYLLDYLVQYYGVPEHDNFESWVMEFL